MHLAHSFIVAYCCIVCRKRKLFVVNHRMLWRHNIINTFVCFLVQSVVVWSLSLCVQSWKCSSGITMDPFLGSTYHFEARELWWPPTGWHVSHWRGVRQMLLQTAGSCDFPPVTAWGLYRKFAAIVHSKHYCSDIHLSADGDTLYTSLYSGILAETEVLSSYSSLPLV